MAHEFFDTHTDGTHVRMTCQTCIPGMFVRLIGLA